MTDSVKVACLSAVILCMLFHANGANIDEACTSNADCSTVPNSECNKTCQCAATYYKQNVTTCAKKGFIGDPCTMSKTCEEGSANAMCNSKKQCECKTGYYTKGTQCIAKIAHGAPCNATAQCIGENAECKKTMCSCIDTHYHNTDCVPRIAPGQACHNNENASCVVNSYCFQSNSTCMCLTGYTPTATECSGSGAVAFAAQMTVLMIGVLLSYMEVLK